MEEQLDDAVGHRHAEGTGQPDHERGAPVDRKPGRAEAAGLLGHLGGRVHGFLDPVLTRVLFFRGLLVLGADFFLRPDLGILRRLAGAVHLSRLPPDVPLKHDRGAQLPSTQTNTITSTTTATSAATASALRRTAGAGLGRGTGDGRGGTGIGSGKGFGGPSGLEVAFGSACNDTLTNSRASSATGGSPLARSSGRGSSQ